MLTPRGDEVLVDLHIHVGAAVALHVLWRSPTITGSAAGAGIFRVPGPRLRATPSASRRWTGYLDISTLEVAHRVVAGRHRALGLLERHRQGVPLLARLHHRVRFQPHEAEPRRRAGPDDIIAAAIRGMERACLAYGIRAGLIFCLAREFDYELNHILVRKAEQLPGPWRGRHRPRRARAAHPRVRRRRRPYHDLFARARDAGLGTTIHTGETSHTADGVLAVLEKLAPDRIGHGIAAARSKELMRRLADQGTVLELAPRRISDARRLGVGLSPREVYQTLRDAGVRTTINTDGTYLLRTTLRREFELRWLIRSSTPTTSCAPSRPRASRHSSGRGPARGQQCLRGCDPRRPVPT